MTMELLVASAIAVLTAAGVYLVLRGRTFPVVLGLAFLSYAINLFLFAMGRLVINRNPTSHIELAGHLRSQNPNIEQGHDHASSHIATEVSLGVRQKGLVTHVGLHARIGDDPVPVEPGTLEAVKGRDADVIVLVELGREESCLLAVARWAPACVAVPKERLSLGSVTH